ncbi:MAG: PleD family two-component system response regulator [Planctomycetota bacterium]|jgi:CheY-like chemotaxis protein
MSRIVLVHWNAAEGEERADRMRSSGHDVRVHSDEGGAGLRAVREDPPDAFVIDLRRLPSHGRAVGLWLRQTKTTRHVPIVFVEGEPAKTALVRDLLPDAAYTDWRHVRGALRRAIARPPENPVVPQTMAGYSGTPLVKKLGIKPGATVALLGAPEGFEETLGPLPEGVRLKRQARGKSDLILLFVESRAKLARRFPAALRALAERGGIWIAWPKKTSGVESDLNQVRVRAFGLEREVVDYKICAIDETWSGLLFTRRRNRTK